MRGCAAAGGAVASGVVGGRVGAQHGRCGRRRAAALQCGRRDPVNRMPTQQLESRCTSRRQLAAAAGASSAEQQQQQRRTALRCARSSPKLLPPSSSSFRLRPHLPYECTPPGNSCRAGKETEQRGVSSRPATNRRAGYRGASAAGCSVRRPTRRAAQRPGTPAPEPGLTAAHLPVQRPCSTAMQRHPTV